jgi:hypothetical protein
MNPNYNVIPYSVEKKIPKKHLKFVLYQNKICGFLLQVPLALLTLSSKLQLFISSFSLLLLQNSPLWNHPNSHHNDPKQQKFKIQTNKVP